MFTEERHQLILGLLGEAGRVDASMLAERFAVTPETIRRDLNVLERQGLVKRTRGGAIPIRRLGFEPNTSIRAGVMVEEKTRIAKVALDQIPAEGAILLDAGTTVLGLAEIIPNDRPLTVVTNSLPVAAVLADRANVSLMLLGGRFRRESLCNVGEWTVRAMADICPDVAFLGTNGLSVGRGLTTSDQGEATVKTAMANSAHRIVVLADHSKIGADYFCRFADLSKVDALVTDADVDPDLADELREQGIDVATA